MANNGDLRVWWIPQIPMKPFYIQVKNIAEAKLILNTLAEYDKFQHENGIKPDYSNVGGLEVYSTEMDGDEPMGWCEWVDDYDCDIHETGKD